MSARVLRGEDSQPVGKAQGIEHYVWIKVTAEPELKSALVDLAAAHGRCYYDEVRVALRAHVFEESV